MRCQHIFKLLVAFFLLASAMPAVAETVHFPSLEDNGPGQPPTQLRGLLFRPHDVGIHAALILLHDCAGLTVGRRLDPRLETWSAAFYWVSYVVLIVDSLQPRGLGDTCPAGVSTAELRVKRAKDAYAALAYLHTLEFVNFNQVALLGWGQGGGAVLDAIRSADSLGRPHILPRGDFRAAGRVLSRFLQRSGAGPSLVEHDPASRPRRRERCLDPDRALPRADRRCGGPGRAGRAPGLSRRLPRFDWPALSRRALPQYRTADAVPIVGTDPVARRDALVRVPAYLVRILSL